MNSDVNIFFQDFQVDKLRDMELYGIFGGVEQNDNINDTAVDDSKFSDWNEK